MDDGGSEAVRLSDEPSPGTLFAETVASTGDIDAALALAVRIGHDAPLPGAGATLDLWQRLATIAAADPTVARIVEPHLDAIAIIAELSAPIDLASLGADPTSTWGVFAAEGAGLVLEATDDDGWTLTGTKPWCSLGDALSHALVTARTVDGSRGLFAVALDDRVTSRPDAWFARGLADVPSGPLDFAAAPAIPVGEPGWYLKRPGFAWGGIGVAAIWWGASVGIARALDRAAREREPDQIALMHLGRVDTALWSARSALRESAATIDAGHLDRDGARLLAARTRGVVADAAERVLTSVAHALGPAPLALDDRHAGRVADLGLYVRQHHAERDEAAIGRVLLEVGPSW